jgi:hypothetical protein
MSLRALPITLLEPIRVAWNLLWSAVIDLAGDLWTAPLDLAA